jgi:hypothetical protein
MGAPALLVVSPLPPQAVSKSPEVAASARKSMVYRRMAALLSRERIGKGSTPEASRVQVMLRRFSSA